MIAEDVRDLATGNNVFVLATEPTFFDFCEWRHGAFALLEFEGELLGDFRAFFVELQKLLFCLAEFVQFHVFFEEGAAAHEGDYLTR